MNFHETLATNVAILRNQDPDTIVDVLGISSEDLVLALLDHIEEYTDDNGEVDL